MLADQRGNLHASAASSENARLLELFELQTGAGPCLAAYRTATQVVNADLRAGSPASPRSTPCRCACAPRSSVP
jgi:hypothetical protein